MKTKTEAIVLRTVRYGDTRLIVDMFTREHGRLSFMVPMAKNPRSTLKKQYFQPLTLLNIDADVRPTAGLQRLHSADLASPWQSLLAEPAKVAIALFIAEFLSHALRGEQADTRLFDFVRSSLQWLDGCTRGYANFHIVFLMHLSPFLGFYPNLEVPTTAAAAPPYFDLRAATFCAEAPPHHDYLMPGEAAHIRLLMRMNFATMHLFRLSRAERSRLLQVIIAYYRLHLPALPELRSLDVLHEVFD